VFENRVLKRFGMKKSEVIRGWRKLHNGKLRNLHSSTNIIRMIESRRIRWVWHVARIGEKRNAYMFLWESQKGETTRKT
jgi:hypothetical protein